MDEVATSGQGEAFKRLYPEQFYDRFLQAGLRPDGRVLGLARETTIGISPISNVDSSALVKIGNTAAIAGVNLDVQKPDTDSPEEGLLTVEVDIPPASSPNERPGRTSERSLVLSQQLQRIVRSAKAVDLTDLCIVKSCAVWSVRCNVDVLSDDGSLLDACLAAAVAALATLNLPAVSLSKEGQVISGEAEDAATTVEGRPLPMGSVPMSLTCGVRAGKVVADLTAEEEELMEATITVAVDQAGRIVGLDKPGGVPVSEATLQDCVEMCRLRYKTVSELLSQALRGAAA